MVGIGGVLMICQQINGCFRNVPNSGWRKDVFDIIKSVNSPNVKMLYDIYHQNMMGDFSVDDIKENIDRIGHFHVADCPGRHEPGTGNVNYQHIIGEICKLDYSGYIGLEYMATKQDQDTFDFLKEI